MAASITVVAPSVDQLDKIRHPVTAYEIQWVADGAGAVTALTTARSFSGTVVRIVTDPGAAVAETYALTIKDQHGIDLLSGLATACSASASENWLPFDTRTVTTTIVPIQFNIDGPLTINISSVTADSTGSIFVYIR